MDRVTGNVTGLKPSELRALERVYRRRIAPREVVSADLAAEICKLSRDLERQVGVLATRRGDVEHVFVGEASRIVLPEVGRLRAGRGRFRGLRLVHTHLRNEPLTHDDLVDLALLRLDLVAAIGVTRDGRPADLHLAHLLPPRDGGPPWTVLRPEPCHRAGVDPVALLAALEEEFARVLPTTVATPGTDRALLVVVELKRGPREEHAWQPDLRSRTAELRELCRTAGIEITGAVEQRRPEPDPRYLIGRGKLEEVLVRAMQFDANLLVFDPDLTPGQARVIADFTDLKVVDRTMLILDIFAQRARSRDAKLQVELAQLRYRLPRLQEQNTMLSRLVGGIGGRGPGETKLEVSRRRVRERMHRLEQEIDRARRQRAGRRALRSERALPAVAIIGYTNAGKSTLLNTLTGSDVPAESRLFATLDPTTRRLYLRSPRPTEAPAAEAAAAPPEERTIILADTVGFIRDLPRDLAQAFRATLEELHQADLFIHVADASSSDREWQIAAVERILGELGLGETPRLPVWNKLDLLAPAERTALLAKRNAIGVSARDRNTLGPLLGAVEAGLRRQGRRATPAARHPGLADLTRPGAL